MRDVVEDRVQCSGAVGTVGGGGGRVCGLGEAVQHRTSARPAQEEAGPCDLVGVGLL